MGRGTTQVWEQRHISTGDHFFEQNELRSGDLGRLETVGEKGILNMTADTTVKTQLL